MNEKLEFIRGIVRPIISLSFVAIVGWMTYKEFVDPKDILAITGMIVAFHFGERAALKGGNNGKA